MANSTSTNPIFLDTFSSDIVVTTTRSRIKTIVFVTQTAGDLLTLEDPNGVNIVYLRALANDPVILDFGANGFPCEALTCDVSDGQYASTARVLIYLA